MPSPGPCSQSLGWAMLAFQLMGLFFTLIPHLIKLIMDLIPVFKRLFSKKKAQPRVDVTVVTSPDSDIKVLPPLPKEPGMSTVTDPALTDDAEKKTKTRIKSRMKSRKSSKEASVVDAPTNGAAATTVADAAALELENAELRRQLNLPPRIPAPATTTSP